MNLKIIQNERKNIRREFKKYKHNSNGIFLLIEKKNIKNSKITFVLDEMNRILPNDISEFYYNINSAEDIKNINNLVSLGKTVITNIKLDNDLDLVKTLKSFDNRECLKFLNNLNLILN